MPQAPDREHDASHHHPEDLHPDRPRRPAPETSPNGVRQQVAPEHTPIEQAAVAALRASIRLTAFQLREHARHLHSIARDTPGDRTAVEMMMAVIHAVADQQVTELYAVARTCMPTDEVSTAMQPIAAELESALALYAIMWDRVLRQTGRRPGETPEVDLLGKASPERLAKEVRHVHEYLRLSIDVTKLRRESDTDGPNTGAELARLAITANVGAVIECARACEAAIGAPDRDLRALVGRVGAHVHVLATAAQNDAAARAAAPAIRGAVGKVRALQAKLGRVHRDQLRDGGTNAALEALEVKLRGRR